MKRILLAILLCLAPSVARAGGYYWSQYSPGWATWTDGTTNNGYIYRWNGCQYVQYSAITNYATAAIIAPAFTDDDAAFGVEALKVGNAIKRRDSQERIIAAMGFTSPTAATYGSMTANGYMTTSVSSTGYAALGYPAFGAIPAQIPLDRNALINNFNRSTDRVLDAFAVAHAGVGDIVNQATVADANLAAFNAIEEASTRRWLAVNTQQTVQQYTQPGQQSTSTTITQSVQPQAAADSNLDYAMKLADGMATWAACAKCHVPSQQDYKSGNGAPDLTARFLSNDPATKQSFVQQVALRIEGGGGKPQMPSGGQPLPEEKRKNLLAYLSAGQANSRGKPDSSPTAPDQRPTAPNSAGPAPAPKPPVNVPTPPSPAKP